MLAAPATAAADDYVFCNGFVGNMQVSLFVLVMVVVVVVCLRLQYNILILHYILQDPQAGCSTLFYSCGDGAQTAIRQECAKTQNEEILAFDMISNQCLFPQYVAACGGVATTTTPLPQLDVSTDLPGGSWVVCCWKMYYCCFVG